MGALAASDIIDRLPTPIARDARPAPRRDDVRSAPLANSRWSFSFDGWHRSGNLDEEFALA